MSSKKITMKYKACKALQPSKQKCRGSNKVKLNEPHTMYGPSNIPCEKCGKKSTVIVNDRFLCRNCV